MLSFIVIVIFIIVRFPDLIRGNSKQMEALQTRYDEASRLFRASDQFAELNTLFQEKILKQEKIEINQVICLALASFSAGLISPDDDYHQGNQTMSQFVLFEYWLDLLKTKENFTGFSEGVFFQDPDFDALDKTFLTSRGYKVLEPVTGLEAMEKMTEKTFLFCPCGNVKSLLYDSLKVAHPTLMISTTVENVDAHYKNYSNDGRLIGTDWIPPLFSDWTKYGFPNLNPERKEKWLAERRLHYAFINERVFHPLWRFTDYSDGDYFGYYPGLARQRMNSLSQEVLGSTFSWFENIWIYWRPDDKRLLRKFELWDELDCRCFGMWSNRSL